MKCSLCGADLGRTITTVDRGGVTHVLADVCGAPACVAKAMRERSKGAR